MWMPGIEPRSSGSTEPSLQPPVSLFTVWFLGIKVRLSGFAARALPAEPCHGVFVTRGLFRYTQWDSLKSELP